MSPCCLSTKAFRTTRSEAIFVFSLRVFIGLILCVLRAHAITFGSERICSILHTPIRWRPGGMYDARDHDLTEESDLNPYCSIGNSVTSLLQLRLIGSWSTRPRIFAGNGARHASKKQSTFTRRYALFRSQFGRHGFALSPQTKHLYARNGRWLPLLHSRGKGAAHQRIEKSPPSGYRHFGRR
jgi:hypothetical protein